MEQRKLILPAFHGERVEGLTGLVAEVTESRGTRAGQRNRRSSSTRVCRALTLEIILRAVFGLDPGQRLRRAARRISTGCSHSAIAR